MAQLALNAKMSDTTKITPYFANYDPESNLFERERKHLAVQSAIEKIETLKKVHDNIVNMQNISAIYQNKKRKMTSQLKEKDKIYLLPRNLKIKKPKKRKLNYVKIGPLFIKAVKKPVNYELDLSKNAKVFPVSHISLLEPADPSTPI